jgi:hypothetical protein
MCIDFKKLANAVACPLVPPLTPVCKHAFAAGPSLVSPLNPTEETYSVNFAVVSRNAASMSLCLARAQDGALGGFLINALCDE